MLSTVVKRAAEFFSGTVSQWYQEVLCKLVPDRQHQSNALLAGIFLQLQALNEGLQAGGTYFRIAPFRVEANGEAVLVLDNDSQGRIREVSLALDSAVGGPDPTIRFATSGGSPNGNGVRLTPGIINPIGRVPPNEKLFVSSDTTINGFIIEVA